jgi:hypothetical protein
MTLYVRERDGRSLCDAKPDHFRVAWHAHREPASRLHRDDDTVDVVQV